MKNILESFNRRRWVRYKRWQYIQVSIHNLERSLEVDSKKLEHLITIQDKADLVEDMLRRERTVERLKLLRF